MHGFIVVVFKIVCYVWQGIKLHQRPISLLVRTFIHLPVCFPSWLSVHVPICVYVRLSVDLSVRRTVSVCLSLCLSVCLSVCLYLLRFRNFPFLVQVETSSDSYLVVSGLPERNGIKHAGEIASMSLRLVAYLKEFKISHMQERTLQFRIGIHSGKHA